MSDMSRINLSSRIDGQTKISLIYWKIPKFDYLLENKGTREFRSEKLNDEHIDFNHTRFQLRIQFLGHNNDIIEIYYLSTNQVFLRSILIIQLEGNKEQSIANKEYHTIDGNKWQYLATLFKKDAASYNSDSFLLKNGSLSLKFEFMVSNDIKNNSSNVPKAQLSSDFESLLNSGSFSDVTIKSTEGKEYRAHKAVLASRSTVLKAHFDHNTTESYTNVIESPLDSEVLKEVLTFIYSDKAPRVNEFPEKLLAAADYYQLCRLKSICEEALYENLTVDNVIETLQLADLHSAKTLKQLVLEFIKDGQARFITKTEGWATLKSVELIKTIYEFIVADELEADKSKVNSACAPVTNFRAYFPNTNFNSLS